MTTDKQGASALPHGLPVPYLTSGSHDSPEEGLCLIEAAAYHAGKPHSDHADGVCPVLGAFGRALNDGPWPSDKARTEALGPLVAKLVGTRSTVAVERARAAFLAQRALTVYAPLALDAAAASLERFGIDCAKLRAATLALRERPSLETATAARAAARAADAAAYAAAAAARADARASASARAAEEGHHAEVCASRASRAAYAAYAAASAAVYAAAAAYAAADAAAYAAAAARAAATGADAIALADASTASGALTVLCLAADDLRAACEITEATL